MDQITIWAGLAEDTPRTIAALLADPRTDDDTGPATPATSPAPSVHSGPASIDPTALPEARTLPDNCSDPRGRRYLCAPVIPGVSSVT